MDAKWRRARIRSAVKHRKKVILDKQHAQFVKEMAFRGRRIDLMETEQSGVERIRRLRVRLEEIIRETGTALPC